MTAASLDDLGAKVEAGESLSPADIATLGQSRDIIKLGMLASVVRRKLHGTDVTYVRVADVMFAPDSGTALQAPLSAADESAGEIRIVHTPGTLDACVQRVESMQGLVSRIPLSAFCLHELAQLSDRLPVVLTALRKAGLEMVAQAPIDRLTEPERTLEALTDAGLQLARLTVDTTPEREWTSVCRDVAALQTKLGSIRAFAPLARRIDATQPTTGYEDVKRVAISRLLADNVPAIQVDWALYGPKLAQVALTFGADDIDSVPADDDQSKGRRRAPVEEIRRSIRAAGFEPVERDGRFRRR